MDDLERRLRDLGEGVEKSLGDAPVLPRPEVPRKARARRSAALVGTVLLTAGVVVAGFTGVSAMVGRSYPTADPIVLSAAAQATELQGTARSRFEMKMEFDFGGRAVEATTAGEGEIDFKENRSHFIAEVNAGGESQTLEFVQDDLIMYTKGAPGTEGWVRAEALASGGFGNQDIRPGDYLEYLDDVSERIEILGQEVVDGETVTRYRAEIDPELASADMPDEATEMLDDFEIEYAPFEVWIDGRGFVRQMSFGFIMDGEATGQSFSSNLSFTTSFYDFGAPVAIELPDESEITEVGVGEEFGGSGSAISTEVDPTKDKSLYLTTSVDWSRITGVMRDDQSLCLVRVPIWATDVDLMKSSKAPPLVSFHQVDLEEGDDGKLAGCRVDLQEGLKKEIKAQDGLFFRVTGLGKSVDFGIAVGNFDG